MCYVFLHAHEETHKPNLAQPQTHTPPTMDSFNIVEEPTTILLYNYSNCIAIDVLY